jgi:hypothetical protein
MDADIVAAIWAAGFFDGEGCVHIGLDKLGRRSTLRVCVAQVDPEPLNFLCDRWGGRVKPKNVKRKGRQRRAFQWYLDRKSETTRFLADIRPYSRCKAEQIDVALEFSAMKNNHGGRHSRLTPEDVSRRNDLHGRLCLLKRLEYAA